MKHLIYAAIVATLLMFIPIITYDKPVGSGVTRIESKTVVQWVIERYKTVQETNEEELEKLAPVAQ